MMAPASRARLTVKVRIECSSVGVAVMPVRDGRKLVHRCKRKVIPTTLHDARRDGEQP